MGWSGDTLEMIFGNTLAGLMLDKLSGFVTWMCGIKSVMSGHTLAFNLDQTRMELQWIAWKELAQIICLAAVQIIHSKSHVTKTTCNADLIVIKPGSTTSCGTRWQGVIIQMCEWNKWELWKTWNSRQPNYHTHFFARMYCNFSTLPWIIFRASLLFVCGKFW